MSDLQQLIDKGRSLTWEQALPLFTDICKECRKGEKDKNKEIRLAPEQIIINENNFTLEKIGEVKQNQGKTLPELLEFALFYHKPYKKKVPAAVYKLVANKDARTLGDFVAELEKISGEKQTAGMKVALSNLARYIALIFVVCLIVGFLWNGYETGELMSAINNKPRVDERLKVAQDFKPKFGILGKVEKDRQEALWTKCQLEDEKKTLEEKLNKKTKEVEKFKSIGLGFENADAYINDRKNHPEHVKRFLNDILPHDGCTAEQKGNGKKCMDDTFKISEDIHFQVDKSISKRALTAAFEYALTLLFDSSVKPEKKQKELAEINKTCCQFRSAAANDWKDFYEAVKAAVETEKIAKAQSEEKEKAEIDKNELKMQQAMLKCVYLCQKWHETNEHEHYNDFSDADKVCLIEWTAKVPSLEKGQMLNISLNEKTAIVASAAEGTVTWEYYIRERDIKKTTSRIVLTISDDAQKEFKEQAWLPSIANLLGAEHSSISQEMKDIEGKPAKKKVEFSWTKSN